MSREKAIQDAIIDLGQKLAASQLVCARSGNLSCRLGENIILITATGSALGELRRNDIVKVNVVSGKTAGTKPPSSELLLHQAIYRHCDCSIVIHCHPPLTNAYFAVNRKLPVLTFESRYYLGQVLVVAQKSLTVTRPGPVIAALAKNKLAVLKNHGVVSTGRTFVDALAPIQILEETVKTVCVARLFRKKSLDGIDRAIQKYLRTPEIS